MALRVKQGRKYYFEGREYGSGEIVTAKIPESYIAQLTNAWGPLEQTGGAMPNKTDFPHAPETADVAALRAQYREVTGRPPFNGWGVEALRQKIGEYRTTHMVARK